MKEEKYYTPEIEEFHVGFEYEAFHNKKWFFAEGEDHWVKSKVNFGTDILIISYAVDHDFVRVKKLDREDIESLGFDNYIPPREYDHTWHYNGSRDPKIKVWFNNKFPTVRMYSSYPAIQFQGTIKNKSELKKLLKQIGIC